MAAEPKKKIEELLQSYSRKRREDAGAPLDMHPATRRMLQGEVARHHRQAGGANSASPRPWWKALLLFGPKYAGAIGMFAILALGVWVITQQDDRPTSVPQETSDRRAGTAVEAGRPPGELPQRESEKLNELDDAAGAPSPAKEAESKKTELAKAGDKFREQKAQTRDADGPAPAAAATPTPSPPQLKMTEELMREKQVSLQSEPAVGQRIANVIAGGAEVSSDKASAALADRAGAPMEQFYKRSEAKADALSVTPPASQPLTPRLDLAAAKPASNSYAYSISSVSNVTLGVEGATALHAGVEFAATNARAEALLAFSDAVAPGATEWAAVPADQPAKNEVERTRELKVLSRVAQESESRESASPTLLRRFSVEETNSTIRIRDAEDGSVYVGEMLAIAEPNVDTKAKDSTDEFRQLRRGDEAASAGRAFRASGINQRSKQVVIINGELTEEQEHAGEFVGKSFGGVSGARGTAPRSPLPTSPTTTSAGRSPADARSLGSSDQAAAGDRPQGQAGATVRSAPAPVAARGTGTSTVSTSAVWRATTLRARVQIGATNELNFRAIRTR